jgi:hypothetical protein
VSVRRNYIVPCLAVRPLPTASVIGNRLAGHLERLPFAPVHVRPHLRQVRQVMRDMRRIRVRSSTYISYKPT